MGSQRESTDRLPMFSEDRVLLLSAHKDIVDTQTMLWCGRGRGQAISVATLGLLCTLHNHCSGFYKRIYL